jgi:hypothetical protein
MKPTKPQKLVAYLMVLTGYAFWAQREGDSTHRAHYRVNADEILGW